MSGHGDLNSGNLLFEAGSAASYPVVIDFASIERSKDNAAYPAGQHFPFWDFAKLERDLKTRLYLNEALAEGLNEQQILSVVRDVDDGRAPSHAPSASSAKLWSAISSLRTTVRQEFAPTLYQGCYKLAVAYSTLSILYRTTPDTDLPNDVQGRVAVESAVTLLQSCLTTGIGSRLESEDGPRARAKSFSNPKSANTLEQKQSDKAEMLLLRLHDFQATCVVGREKGGQDHLIVPGNVMDMTWGSGSNDERLAWLYVVDDLLKRGLLEKTERNKEYKLSEDGQRQAWQLSMARRLD